MSDSSDDAGLSRRSFVGTLAVGTAVGAATVATTGCAGLLPSMHGSASDGDFDASAFLAQLDEGLEEIDRTPVLSAAVGPERMGQSARARAFVERAEPVAKRAIRSLYVTGLYRDLPEHGRADSRVEQRKQELLPELDHSVSEMTAMLASMTPEAHAGIRRALERNPDAAMRVAEVFKERSTALHVPLGSRAKLRAAATDITFRLRRQPPELLINEYVSKVERLAARSGLSLVVQQQVAAHAMQDAFWGDSQPRQSGGRSASGGQEVPPQRPPPQTVIYETRLGPPPPEAVEPRPGSGVMHAAGWIGGIGAVVFGLGGIVVAAGAFEGLFVMTVGAVLGLIALIVVIVGAIMNAAA